MPSGEPVWFRATLGRRSLAIVAVSGIAPCGMDLDVSSVLAGMFFDLEERSLFGVVGASAVSASLCDAWDTIANG